MGWDDDARAGCVEEGFSYCGERVGAGIRSCNCLNKLHGKTQMQTQMQTQAQMQNETGVVELVVNLLEGSSDVMDVTVMDVMDVMDAMDVKDGGGRKPGVQHGWEEEVWKH